MRLDGPARGALFVGTKRARPVRVVGLQSSLIEQEEVLAAGLSRVPAVPFHPFALCYIIYLAGSVHF